MVRVDERECCCYLGKISKVTNFLWFLLKCFPWFPRKYLPQFFAVERNFFPRFPHFVFCGKNVESLQPGTETAEIYSKETAEKCHLNLLK